MLKEMRAEVLEELAKIEGKRPAVLRRSDLPRALLACDLPTVAEPAAVARFSDAMQSRGWRVEQVVIWLMLDKPVPVPEADLSEAPQDGEAAAVISLLSRHASPVQDEEAVRALAKAAEAGRRELDRLCRRLHQEWAERLRLGQPLPGLLLPYLIQAWKEVGV